MSVLWKIYSLIFWIPACASAVRLVQVRALGLVQGGGWLLACVWFLVALGMQVLGRDPLLRATGIALQSALAIFLSIKVRLDT